MQHQRHHQAELQTQEQDIQTVLLLLMTVLDLRAFFLQQPGHADQLDLSDLQMILSVMKLWVEDAEKGFARQESHQRSNAQMRIP